METIVAKGNNVKDITQDQLDSETSLGLKVSQQEFQSQIDQVKNQFGALGTPVIRLSNFMIN